MYAKKFIPLTDEEIKRVNASALAKEFECTSAWVGRVMRCKSLPKNEKAQKIHASARRIVESYKCKSI